MRAARSCGPAVLASVLTCGLFGLPPASDAQAPPGASMAELPMDGMDGMAAPSPGMAQLMEILGPGVACPRGGCGYGLDGIPEPYAGGGLRGANRAAARATGTVFPASRTSLLSWMSSADMTGSPVNANDVWGYVSPSGREYAIVGLRTGTAFVEITDPADPQVVAVIDGPTSEWRDMAVYRRFAYSVNERGGGIQVIDLRRIDEGKVRLRRSVTDGGLRTAHNIFVNDDSGYAYLLGANLSRGGLVAVDLSRPARPKVEPVMWDVTYVHDVQVVSYARGRYAGREIAFAFTGREGLHIVDVTDKDAPRTLSHLQYTNGRYGHSGWLSDNRKLLYVNDEFDERTNAAIDGMTTYVIRVARLESPRLVRTKNWGLPFIDHNSMVQNGRLYVSAYQGGLRVIDVSKPAKPKMRGWFDTHPEGDAAVFNGAWGVFAGFPSGNVIVTDVQRGLFVIRAAGK